MSEINSSHAQIKEFTNREIIYFERISLERRDYPYNIADHLVRDTPKEE